jgi:hypothetical protein
MSLQKPALDPQKVEPRSRSSYPEPYRSRVLPREARALGEALGRTRIGVNLVRVLAGKQSSMTIGTRTRMSFSMCSRGNWCCARKRASSS